MNKWNKPSYLALHSIMTKPKSLCSIVPDKPGIAYKIVGAVADANIEVDMIIQNVSKDGKTDFSFTVHRNDFAKAMDLLKTTLVPQLGAQEVIGDAKICKVSIVGIECEAMWA